MRLPVGVVDDRKWFTPIPLPREQPIPELVFDPPASASVGFETFCHHAFRVVDSKAVQRARIDQQAVTDVSLDETSPPAMTSTIDNPEFGRELPVALVMPGTAM